MSTTKYGFTKMSTSEFKSWIKKQGDYKYTGIQIHHTAAPAYKHFYKSDGSHEDELTRQYNIKQYHINENGWGDIAQHFTIFPNGKIVTGRKLSKTTAIGIKGWNSNKICIEIYGNFDKGQDKMTSLQKNAVITVYGELCKKFNITPSTSTIRCHAWFTAGGTYLGDYSAPKSAKSCPGTNFMGFGNTKKAIRDNFIPLIQNYIKTGSTTSTSKTTTSTTSKYTTGIYKITADTLNVRKGPGTSYDKVGSVKKGDSYTITKVSGNWGYLGKLGTGWICLKGYTEKVDTGSTSTSETTSKYTTGIYRITTDTLNVRKGPGTSYDKVDTVKKGDAYTVTKVSGDWGYLGKLETGWICLKGYTEKVK